MNTIFLIIFLALFGGLAGCKSQPQSNIVISPQSSSESVGKNTMEDNLKAELMLFISYKNLGINNSEFSKNVKLYGTIQNDIPCEWACWDSTYVFEDRQNHRIVLFSKYKLKPKFIEIPCETCAFAAKKDTIIISCINNFENYKISKSGNVIFANTEYNQKIRFFNGNVFTVERGSLYGANGRWQQRCQHPMFTAETPYVPISDTAFIYSLLGDDGISYYKISNTCQIDYLYKISQNDIIYQNLEFYQDTLFTIYEHAPTNIDSSKFYLEKYNIITNERKKYLLNFSELLNKSFFIDRFEALGNTYGMITTYDIYEHKIKVMMATVDGLYIYEFK